MILLLLLSSCSGPSDKSSDDSQPPASDDSGLPAPTGEIVSIAMDGLYALAALTVDGELLFWDAVDQMPWSRGWRSISTSNSQICGLRIGSAVCSKGTFGWTNISMPFPLTAAWVRLECSSYADECCALTDQGGLYCWGADSSEWVSPSGVSDFAAAFWVPAPDVLHLQDGVVTLWSQRGAVLDHRLEGEAIAVASGNYRSCVLRPDRTIDCTAESGEPPPPEGTFSQMFVGEGGSSCAVNTGGGIECWSNYPDPDPDYQHYSFALNPPEGSYSQVVVSDELGCAITAGGCVVCWSDEWDYEGHGPGLHPTIDDPLCHAGQLLTDPNAP